MTGESEVIPGPEVGLEDIAIDFPQARFWIVSAFADNSPSQ
jgi:hemolysin activation/secretion protein